MTNNMEHLPDEQYFLDDNTEALNGDSTNVSQCDDHETSSETDSHELDSILFFPDAVQDDLTRTALLNDVSDGIQTQQSATSDLLTDTFSTSLGCSTPTTAHYQTNQREIPKTQRKTKKRFQSIPEELTNENLKRLKSTLLDELPKDVTELNCEGIIIEVKSECIKNLDHIGKGCYSLISKIEIHGHRMAIKHLPLTTNESAIIWQNELKMVKKIPVGTCSQIIGYYGLFINTIYSELNIFMELMDTTIEHFYKTMHKIIETLCHDNIKEFLVRLAHVSISALAFLASKRYLHGDIKPLNILISKSGAIKVCDLGTSCEIDENGVAKDMNVGTIAYFSPALSTHGTKLHTIQDDMWAVGITLVEVTAGKHPCQISNNNNIQWTIIKWEPVVPDMIKSAPIGNLVSSLLKKDARHRPHSYDEILDRPPIKNLPTMLSNSEHKFIINVFERIDHI